MSDARDQLIARIDQVADYADGAYGTPAVADLVLGLLAEAWDAAVFDHGDLRSPCCDWPRAGDAANPYRKPTA